MNHIRRSLAQCLVPKKVICFCPHYFYWRTSRIIIVNLMLHVWMQTWISYGYKGKIFNEKWLIYQSVPYTKLWYGFRSASPNTLQYCNTLLSVLLVKSLTRLQIIHKCWLRTAAQHTLHRFYTLNRLFGFPSILDLIWNVYGVPSMCLHINAYPICLWDTFPVLIVFTGLLLFKDMNVDLIGMNRPLAISACRYL